MLTVGVAGNRRLQKRQLPRIESELDAIAEDLCLVVSAPQRQAGNALSLRKGTAQKRPLKLISSLAEGADRLAFTSERFIRHQEIDLQRAAILPFSRDEFAKDFNATNSVINNKGTLAEFNEILRELEAQGDPTCITELKGTADNRNKAYNTCSKNLVDCCDVLIAIFDPKPKLTLGTAFTVQSAAEADLCVIHIPNSPGPTRLIVTDESGRRHNLDYSRQNLHAALSRTIKTTNTDA